MTGQDGAARGILIAAASALFLGMSPVFGKIAILAGLHPLAVVAVRTAGAAALLTLLILLFRRAYFYIYPLGLVGCLLAGGFNGIGSLLYYSGLARLDAALAQLLFALYPLFVAMLTHLDGGRLTRLTVLRLALSVPAIYLLTAQSSDQIDPIGVGMMLGASLLYALHIPINSRVLYEAPAPTVTLYTLLAMTGVVVPAYFLLAPMVVTIPEAAVAPLLAMTGFTFLSRLTLFLGVKLIGGLQTALLGLGELLVVITLAHLWLGEALNSAQWAGAGLLIAALMLVVREPSHDTSGGPGWFHWLLPPIPANVPGGQEQAEAGND